MKKFTQIQVENLFNEYNYKVLSEYKNNRTPLIIECPNGHITKTITLSNFKKGWRCSVCSRKAKLTYDFVKCEFLKEGYKVVSKEYKNANTKLTIKCPKGHNWEATYAHFYDGKRCGICSNNKRLDYNYVKSKFSEEGYTLISEEYINASSPLKIICNEGHLTDTMTWNSFQRGQRCAVCNSSKGELKIMKYLQEKGIYHIHNKPYFKDLVSDIGYPLKPDFIIPDLKMWIEYDGVFHYNKIFKNDNHDRLKQHDILKDDYAKKHNWKLIRIPYWEFDNIENILDKELKL